jgi:hypothetical protein
MFDLVRAGRNRGVQFLRRCDQVLALFRRPPLGPAAQAGQPGLGALQPRVQAAFQALFAQQGLDLAGRDLGVAQLPVLDRPLQIVDLPTQFLQRVGRCRRGRPDRGHGFRRWHRPIDDRGFGIRRCRQASQALLQRGP